MGVRIWIVSGFLLWCSATLWAQGSYRLGFMPQINLNHKLANEWRMNIKLESRPFVRSGTFREERPPFQYSLSDAAILFAKKTEAQQTFSAGYLLRITSEDVHHRLIQQFSLVRRFTAFRIGHRLAADQTFVPEEKMEWRLRYRLSAEFPLSGQQVDPGEFYLKAGNEYLHAFQGNNYDLEMRLTPMLGFVFSDQNKLEAGLDYRLDSFLQGNSRSSFWWKVAWYRAW